MYCRHCGTENENNAKFCENCGKAFLEQETKKIDIKKVIIIVAILAILAIAFVVVKIIDGLPLEEEIVTQELISNMFTERDENVTETKILERTTENNIDNVIIQVTCDNGEVQYVEKYMISYYKDDEWRLGAIDFYDEENWGKMPLSAPTSEDLKSESEKHYYYNGDIEHDLFEISQTEAEIDLENGIAKYYYNIAENKIFYTTTATLCFEYEFDVETEKWGCKDFNYSTPASTEYNFNYIWQGIKSDLWEGEMVFQIKNVSTDGSTVELEFSDNGVVHKMSGTIEKQMDDIEKGFYIGAIDVENERYRLYGWFLYNESDEGEFEGNLFRNYSIEEDTGFGDTTSQPLELDILENEE